MYIEFRKLHQFNKVDIGTSAITCSEICTDQSESKQL